MIKQVFRNLLKNNVELTLVAGSKILSGDRKKIAWDTHNVPWDSLYLVRR
jgi:hypothetical protein